MERTVTVRTPESIAFHYELAGLGSRFLAVAIDFVFQLLLVITIGILLGVAGDRVGQIAKTLHLNGSQMTAVIYATVLMLAFVIFFGYFIIFEAAWNGQTPGKRLLGIRVVRDGGYPIDLGSAVLRNLVRVGEAFLVYIPSAISAVVTSQNKRLGDLVAGTIVVRDRAFEVTNPQTWLSGDAAPAATPLVATVALSPDEWALLDRYVERRTTLPPTVAAATAARVAAALRPKVGAVGDSLTDDDLLLRLFASRRG